VDSLASRVVSIATGATRYSAAPYSPSLSYPEYPFSRDFVSPSPNQAYDGVRRALQLLGCDAGRHGSASWNPLRGIVAPGDCVVLKPNLVREFRETQVGDGGCLVTHGSVIRAVTDYAYLALEGRGRVIIADAPHNDACFESLTQLVGLRDIQAFYRAAAGFEVEVYDLRPEAAIKVDGVIVGHQPLPGDPAGYARVNVGEDSQFCEVDDFCHLLYGSEYDVNEVRRHHHGGMHEYLISGTVLCADVVISIPKLKTHKKVGITANLKNLVGINGNKNWLPHHREGGPDNGGDQFPVEGVRQRVERIAVAQFKRHFPRLGGLRRVLAAPAKGLGKRVFGDTNGGTIRSGNWHGNDTTWRMVLDLNRILLYAGQDGKLRDRPVRRFFSIVDGIVAGEGNGPLDPRARASSVVVAGHNPLATDVTCARLMGFEPMRIPLLRRGFDAHRLPLTSFGMGDIVTRSNRSDYNGTITDLRGRQLAFEPHFGWRGKIESVEEEVTEIRERA